jgi:hypothetical protein
MLRLTDEQARVFADAVAAVGDRGATEIRQLYEAFESERAVVQPRCDASGACCRFEAYGHRLFITTLEMAAFCRCSAHVWRPFGCRVYFCDERTTRWQQDQYERTHAAVRALHDRHSVPYLYVEWRAALKACGIAVERPAGNRLTILH